MFNWISKIILSIAVFLGVSSPAVLPTPEPTQQIISTISSPTASPISTKLSPTPKPIDDAYSEQLKKVNEAKDNFFKPSPTPTLADFCRNIPLNQSLVPLGMYRTADGDCFNSPLGTAAPAPTPTPIQTQNPTPVPTPIPTPAPTAHFLKYGIPYPEIVNLPLVPAPSDWAKTSKINMELVDNSTAELVVSPTVNTVSLGKFLVHLPRDTYIDGGLSVSVAFWSDNLTNRDDGLYGIHKNIFKRVYLKNSIYGEKTLPAQLSEPTDYYFHGNYYITFGRLDLAEVSIPNTQPAKVNFSAGRLLLQDTDMLFEIFLEIQCTNDGCLDSEGNSLSNLNGGILQPKIGISYSHGSRNYDSNSNEYIHINVGTVSLKNDGSMDSSGIVFPGRKIILKVE